MQDDDFDDYDLESDSGSDPNDEDEDEEDEEDEEAYILVRKNRGGRCDGTGEDETERGLGRQEKWVVGGLFGWMVWRK